METRLDYFIVDALNFDNIAKNLLCDDEAKFKRFFEKLYRLDKRALYFFIKSNIGKIVDVHVHYAKYYFEKRGLSAKWI